MQGFLRRQDDVTGRKSEAVNIQCYVTIAWVTSRRVECGCARCRGMRLQSRACRSIWTLAQSSVRSKNRFCSAGNSLSWSIPAGGQQSARREKRARRQAESQPVATRLGGRVGHRLASSSVYDRRVSSPGFNQLTDVYPDWTRPTREKRLPCSSTSRNNGVVSHLGSMLTAASRFLQLLALFSSERIRRGRNSSRIRRPVDPRRL
jgi:hypothetical protein